MGRLWGTALHCLCTIGVRCLNIVLNRCNFLAPQTAIGGSQLFQACATVCHCLTSFNVKIHLDHYCIGDGSYIDVHEFMWA